MATNGFRTLLGLALATVVVFSVARFEYSQGAPVQREAMPGMDMAKPAQAAPAVAAGGTAVTPDPGMAGMEMPPSAVVPPASDTAPPGYTEVNVAPEVQQRIGVTLGRVERTPLTMSIKAVGIVRPNETQIAHIHVKTEGWVEKLYVSFTGQKVKAGQPLLSIYSPAFFAAQREFLSALQASKAGFNQGVDQQTVLETARRRLELWDIPKDEIDTLQRTGEARKSLTLRSPISGTVLEKQAFAGQFVMAQSDLYVVADLSTVWMQASIFQYELPYMTMGMRATVSLSSLGAAPITGRVAFIDPVVDEVSRSVQVRIELPNANGQLRPGMFGSVSIDHVMGTGLTVPAAAVIRTGERDIAFRAMSAGRFVPVEVKISPLEFGDRFQVLAGLKAGDAVVTSANFLIDSESRLEAGSSAMAGMAGMAGMGGSDKPPAVKRQ